MTTSTDPLANVPRWFRGCSWFIETGPDCGYCVQVDGAQRLDGTVTERQVVLDDTELKVDQARQLATALTAAADEVDQGHLADVPLIELLDEVVRRFGADEVCRRLNVSSIDKLRALARE